MRKIERHERNVRLYGEQHCPRQVETRTSSGLVTAFFREMERAPFGAVGLRTDWIPGGAPTGAELGKLPFFHSLRSWNDAFRAYWLTIREFPAPLTVLVCESIPSEHTKANFNAVRVDSQHMLVEMDYGGQAERSMGKDPSKLREFGVGPDSFVFPFGGTKPLRCYHPEEVWRFQMDRVYRFLFTHHEHMLTGTLVSDGRLLFW